MELLLATIPAPKIDWLALSPIMSVLGGAIIVLVAGLFKANWVQRWLVPVVSIVALLIAVEHVAALWGDRRLVIEGALLIDDFSLAISGIVSVAAIVTVFYSSGHPAVRLARSGEYHALLLGSVGGMMVFASAHNLVTFFLGLELLSIPLYVLCGSLLVRKSSLESGLKYLIIGSVGSATMLYGLAFIYGATGSTDFDTIARAVSNEAIATNPILLIGAALTLVGLAFKASVAPFHQWTPDVYQGAPTPITAFMAVATKAAAMGAIATLFIGALSSIKDVWQPAVAALAIITIVVGNLGAINQASLKRMLAYSGVAQAGYMLVAVVVDISVGVQSLIFYLFAYLLMNLAAFGVIITRERESQLGDSLESITGLGQRSPLKAGIMTIAMLSLAGFPATIGFIGKFYLLEAAVDGNFTWLAVAIVIGTMISLIYYLRVVAVMWLHSSDEVTAPVIAGGSEDAAKLHLSSKFPYLATASVLALATVFFGLIPEPLVKLAEDAGRALGIG